MSVQFAAPGAGGGAGRSVGDPEDGGHGRRAAAGPTPAQLVHGLAGCPGLTGPGTRLLVEPRPLARVVADARVIEIPLFQRAYCWAPAQHTQWFADARSGRHAATFDGSHGCGKMFAPRDAHMHSRYGLAFGHMYFTYWHPMRSRYFARRAGDGPGAPLVCIDGQQRVTTFLLLAAAVRDAALALCRRCAAGGGAADGEGGGVAAAAEAAAVADEMNGLLFWDGPAARAWRDTTARTLACGGRWDDAHPPGASLPFGRLVPSYVDRAAFSEAVTAGWVEHGLWDLSAGASGPSTLALSAHESGGAQMAAKACFDAAVAGALGNDTPLGAVARQLGALRDDALSGMSCVYVEVLSDISLPQVFLWLQVRQWDGDPQASQVACVPGFSVACCIG